MKGGADKFAKGLFILAIGLLTGAGYATEHDVEYAVPSGHIVESEFGPFAVAIQGFFWVRTQFTDDGVLRLKQISIHEYSGEIEVLVVSNIGLEFSCAITPICKAGTSEPVIPGDYSSSVTPSSLEAPGGRITVHATIKNADISGTVGCLTVALVTLKVRPRITWQQITPS